MSISTAMRLATDASESALILALGDAHDVLECGGKASRLARAQALGFDVPDGFVVKATAFLRFLKDAGIEVALNDVLTCLRAGERDEATVILSKIEARAGAEPLPSELVGLIEEQIGRFERADALIVRSSAVGEDSGHASFAGQLESIRDLQSPNAVVRAIKQCWTSYWSLSSLSYRIASGVDLAGLAVLVQRQIRSRLSGVIFSRYPDEQKAAKGLMYCEYCYGSGEGLASGELTPGAISIRRTDLTWNLLSQPDQEYEGAEHIELHNDLVHALGRAALILEEHTREPQDIEWTVENDGTLFIVQSRPITAGLHKDHTSLILWSNANINENFPEPVSPLLYSIARDGYAHYFRNLGRAFGISESRLRSVDQSLRNIIGAHGGRLYYNLTSIHEVLGVSPIASWLRNSFDQFVGTDSTHAISQRPVRPAKCLRDRAARLLDGLRVAVCTVRQYLRISDRVSQFESEVDDFATRTEPDVLASKELPDLHRDLLAFLDLRFWRWTNAGLADTAAMASSGLLLQALKRVYSPEIAAQRQAVLLMGLTGLVSRGPAEDLWELAEEVRASAPLAALFRDSAPADICAALESEQQWLAFHVSMKAYLKRWGYRCSRELMLTTPSFSERPEDLITILKIYLESQPPAPAVLVEKQRRARELAADELLDDVASCGIGWIRGRLSVAVTRILLRATHGAIALRERVRLKQALLYGRLRLVALSIGEQLVERDVLEARDDVFFLTYQELDAILSGTALFPYKVTDQIRVRRSEHNRLSEMVVPDVFSLPLGTYLDPHPKIYGGSGPNKSVNGGLSGQGVCPGCITARAAVVDDVNDASKLLPGDVLVTRQTDPGWASVLYLVNGLVTERGGLLSHGAIVAREFGIPAVVGVEGAMREIPHGKKVFLDGASGLVRSVD